MHHNALSVYLLTYSLVIKECNNETYYTKKSELGVTICNRYQFVIQAFQSIEDIILDDTPVIGNKAYFSQSIIHLTISFGRFQLLNSLTKQKMELQYN